MLYVIALISLPIAIMSGYTVQGFKKESLLLILFTWIGFPVAWMVGASNPHHYEKLAFLFYLSVIVVGTVLNRRKL